MLKMKRKGTGGLLFIFTSMALAFMMIVSITFIRASTARSIAESVEHTIALQCLASCYTHPDKYNDYNQWTSNKTFDSVSDSGSDIDPLGEFNSLMTSYNLIDPGRGATQISMVYDKNGNVYNNKKHPTFEIQIAGWTADDTFWVRRLPIRPNPVKVTIEDSYKAIL